MIVIHKAQRVLEAEIGGELVRMKIGLGRDPVGHKAREGDGKTPEGEYCVCTRNSQSQYHLSLGLSYPNERDALEGLRTEAITAVQCGHIIEANRQGKRPPWDTKLGGYIMIHGGGASDWTQGCIALSDSDIETLWDAAPLGTKVTILA